jgi:hypothetical protein
MKVNSKYIFSLKNYIKKSYYYQSNLLQENGEFYESDY